MEGTRVTDVRNVIIIGSGPAGYTAAVYAARARLEPLVLEGSVSWGGALMNTTDVENYPGFRDGIMGPALMEEMRAQAERFGAEFVTDDAQYLDLTGEIKIVRDGSGNEYRARSVILAMGSRYRELGLPNEKRLSGHGVSWCATCDGFFFRDQDMAVVGGGDSAMEEATFLTRFARKVYVIHRRDQLRASKVMQERAFANDKIEFVWNTEVVDILGEDKVSGLTLRNTVTGEQSTLRVSALFVAIGHDPRSEQGLRPVRRHRPRPALRTRRRSGSARRRGLRPRRPAVDPHPPGRGLRRRRPGRPHLPAGRHGSGHRLPGRPRRRAVPRCGRRRRRTGPSRRGIGHRRQLNSYCFRKELAVGSIKHVTDTDFDQAVLKNDKPVLVDFWAEWCGPCRMIAPVLEEIAGTQSKLDIVKLNVDENPATAAAYRITSIPALNVFSGGQGGQADHRRSTEGGAAA